MFTRRLLNGLVAAVMAFLPLAIACGAILAMEAARDAALVTPNRVATPNPSKAPWYFMGPAELVVYADPWFAGTFAFWYYPWLVGLAGYVCAVGVWWPVKSPSSGRSPLLSLAMLSSLLGLIFAAPWFYGLIKIIITHGRP